MICYMYVHVHINDYCKICLNEKSITTYMWHICTCICSRFNHWVIRIEIELNANEPIEIDRETDEEEDELEVMFT